MNQHQQMTNKERKRLVVALSASLKGLPMGPALACFEDYERERNRQRKTRHHRDRRDAERATKAA